MRKRVLSSSAMIVVARAVLLALAAAAVVTGFVLTRARAPTLSPTLLFPPRFAP